MLNNKMSRTTAALMVVLSAGLVGCSSDPVAMGVVSGHLDLCPSSPNCVSSTNEDEKHQIAPLLYKGDKAAAKNKLITVLSSRGDVDIKEQEGEYVRVTFTTSLMKFVDDGEFLIQDNVIEVRSASRVGYSDLGKNRSRIDEIRGGFEPCCE